MDLQHDGIESHLSETTSTSASEQSFHDKIDEERKLLEQRLFEQQRQSEEDSRWLAREEKRLSIATSGDEGGSPTKPRSMTQSPSHEGHNIGATVCASLIGGPPEKNCDQKIIVVKKMEPTPTADLDRANDHVYDCTTNVVRAVMSLSMGVEQSKVNQYLELVRHVGVELRAQLSSVDGLVDILPAVAHRQVEMAHKVLGKDMADLVSAMKLAQTYSCTTLDSEYRRGMLSAAHILAMDAKNLLDVIDSIRIRYPHVNNRICETRSDDDARKMDESHVIAASRSCGVSDEFVVSNRLDDDQSNYTFRQSQSGDVLDVVETTVSDVDESKSKWDVATHSGIVTNSLERNLSKRSQISGRTNSLERKVTSMASKSDMCSDSMSLPPMMGSLPRVLGQLAQRWSPVSSPHRSINDS